MTDHIHGIWGIDAQKLKMEEAASVGGRKLPEREAVVVAQLRDPEGEASTVDMVYAPPHYQSHPRGIECWDYIEENPFFHLATAQKYLHRVSWGSKGSDEQDLRKAIACIQRELKRRGAEA